MAFVEVYQMVLNYLSVSHLTLGWTSLFLNSVVLNRVSLLHLLQLLYTINHIKPALYRPSMGPNLDEFVSSVDAWHGLEWTHWFHLTPFICTHWPTHNKWLLSVKRAMLLKLPMLWILTQQRKTSLSKVKHCSGLNERSRWALSSSVFCWWPPKMSFWEHVFSAVLLLLAHFAAITNFSSCFRVNLNSCESYHGNDVCGYGPQKVSTCAAPFVSDGLGVVISSSHNRERWKMVSLFQLKKIWQAVLVNCKLT